MTTVDSTSGEENVALDLGQIQFDRSITSGAAPLAADMEEGAIALNLVDRKIFTKDHEGNVITLGRDYTADIAAAQANAIASANSYTDGQINGLKGGTLTADLDTLLKIGQRLEAAESNIAQGQQDTQNLTKDDVGLGNVENYGISDSVAEQTSTQYASSMAAYTAFQRGVSAEAAAIAYADAVKSDILGGAPPEALDTLQELAAALTDNDSDIAAITSSLATKATITALNDGLDTKVDKASISDSITSNSATNVASSNAVLLALTDAKAYADAGLALKVDKSVISSVTNSTSETDVASSKAVNDARLQAISHANGLVADLAANLDWGRSF